MPFYSNPVTRLINLSREKYFILSFAFSFSLPSDIPGHLAVPCGPIDWPGPPDTTSFPEIDGNIYEAVTPGGGALNMTPNASSTGISVTMFPTEEGEEVETRDVHAISGVPTELPATFLYAELQHGHFEGVEDELGAGVSVFINLRGAATRKVVSGGTTEYTGIRPVEEEEVEWKTPMVATVSTYLRAPNGEICRFNPDTPEDPTDGITWVSFQGERSEENSVILNFSNIQVELEDEDGQPDGIIWRPVAILVEPLINTDSYNLPDVDVGSGVALLMLPE